MPDQTFSCSSISFPEGGSRLLDFAVAGATLGQLFGSLFAASMAWLGPCMYHSLE